MKELRKEFFRATTLFDYMTKGIEEHNKKAHAGAVICAALGRHEYECSCWSDYKKKIRFRAVCVRCRHD